MPRKNTPAPAAFQPEEKNETVKETTEAKPTTDGGEKKSTEAGQTETERQQNSEKETNTETDAAAAAQHGLTTDKLMGDQQPPQQPPPPASEKEQDSDGGDDDGDDDDIVKSGFEKISIRALCDNGEPFCGSYRSVHFDGNGCAEVTIADRESLEKLQAEFPTLEIKQA